MSDVVVTSRRGSDETVTDVFFGGQHAAVVARFTVDATPADAALAFFDNEASGDGGGLYVGDGASARVANGTFVGNVAGVAGSGGGVYAHTLADVVVSRAAFAANVAGRIGGGLAARQMCSVATTESVFLANAAASGGGAGFDRLQAATVDGCVFENNSAATGGGAWFGGVDLARAAVKRTRFAGNVASGLGGGLAVVDSRVDLEDATFEANAASDGGGVGARGDDADVDCLRRDCEEVVAVFDWRFNEQRCEVPRSTKESGRVGFEERDTCDYENSLCGLYRSGGADGDLVTDCAGCSCPGERERVLTVSAADGGAHDWTRMVPGRFMEDAPFPNVGVPEADALSLYAWCLPPGDYVATPTDVGNHSWWGGTYDVGARAASLTGGPRRVDGGGGARSAAAFSLARNSTTCAFAGNAASGVPPPQSSRPFVHGTRHRPWSHTPAPASQSLS